MKTISTVAREDFESMQRLEGKGYMFKRSREHRTRAGYYLAEAESSRSMREYCSHKAAQFYHTLMSVLWKSMGE